MSGDNGQAATQSQARLAHVRVRAVWRAIGLVAVAGIGTILVLTHLWRTGRLPSVRDVTPSPGAIVAYAGVLPGGGSEPLVSPRSVSADGSSLLVTEPDANRVRIFGLDGRLLRAFTVETSGTVYPIDAVAVGEAVYVVDAAGRRVLAMDRAGKGVRRVAETLEQPSALAWADEALLIADATTGLWRLDDVTGAVTSIAGPEATRGFTGGIVSYGDRILLTDTGGSRVLDVSLAKGDLTAFGERVSLPRGIAVDDERRVWVADVLGGTVKVFDASGVAIGGIEEEPVAGAGRVDIGSPQGVAFATTVGRLYVVDAAAGRVVAFSVAP